MRFTLLVLLTLIFQSFGSHASGQVDLSEYKTSDLTFNGGKKAKCNLVEKSRVYSCLHKDLVIYIDLENYISAVAFDKTSSSIIPLEIQSINSKDETLYQEAVMPALPDYLLSKSQNSKDQNINQTQKVIQNLNVIENFLEGISKKVATTPSLQEIHTNLLGVHSQIRKNFIDIITSPSFIIELDDGTTKTCQRLEAKKGICDLYSCDKNDKAQSLLFFNPLLAEHEYPTLQVFENNHLKNSPHVTKVIHPKTNKVISTFDHSATYSSAQEVKPYLDKSLREDTENILFIKNEFSKETYKDLLNKCAPSDIIKQYDSARENLRMKLANVSLEQLIYILADGTILADFYSHEAATKNGCHHQGIYYNDLAAKKLDKISQGFPTEVLPQQVISAQKVNELFEYATQMSDIAWNYKYDGCYARAHLMARRFEAQGIRVDKAWLKGDLYVPGTDITWNYHVAPLLYVEDEKGNIKKMVIDPSLFDGPVTLEEWDQKMAKKTATGSVKTAFPFPQNADFYERSALAISSSDPYTPGENIDATEEYKMRMAKETMEEYLLN